jgi:RHS repeat-associated protein
MIGAVWLFTKVWESLWLKTHTTWIQPLEYGWFSPTVQSSNTYVYNVVNQISSVNGVNFTWDANGNLTSDGVNTYTYDHADRLTAVQNQTTTIKNHYNGMGDCVQQSVDSVTTTFTLDINFPLTQVLADGTNTYLYGLDRLAQSSLTTEYFLTDALGSSRQLVDASGVVQSVASYEPFGAPITVGASFYGFAGEWQDSYIKLIFLRSRYYSPLTGTFISRDSWQGDYNRPLSLNCWNALPQIKSNY